MSDKEPKGIDNEDGKWCPRNWKKKTDTEIKKLNPVQRSKYLAYENPPKEVAQARESIAKRLLDRKKDEQKQNPPVAVDVVLEKNKHEKLIGQLKAAEARNRLRIMRLRYQANRAQEVNHLIACQPSALKAVRLQALVPPHLDKDFRGGQLDKLDGNRIEGLLEDNRGLLTNRVP